MKVVHVHRIGGIGGSERHLLTLLPALAAKGVSIDRRKIDVGGGIKAIGDHRVNVYLQPDVTAELMVTVLPAE